MKLDITFLTSTYGVKMQRERVDVFLRPVISAGRENMRADAADGIGCLNFSVFSPIPLMQAVGSTHTNLLQTQRRHPGSISQQERERTSGTGRKTVTNKTILHFSEEQNANRILFSFIYPTQQRN